MPIEIPIFLLNQTGPGWDKFVKDAQKAGFAANQVNSVAGDVFGNLLQRKLKESKDATNKLADSFDNTRRSVGGLVDTVKTLNALNITPYGYERMAFRLSSMLARLGPALPFLAAGAAGVAVSLKAVNDKAKEGDERALGLQRAWRSVGESFKFSFRRMSEAAAESEGFRAFEDWLTRVGNKTEKFIYDLPAKWRAAQKDIADGVAEIGKAGGNVVGAAADATERAAGRPGGFAQIGGAIGAVGREAAGVFKGHGQRGKPQEGDAEWQFDSGRLTFANVVHQTIGGLTAASKRAARDLDRVRGINSELEAQIQAALPRAGERMGAPRDKRPVLAGLRERMAAMQSAHFRAMGGKNFDKNQEDFQNVTVPRWRVEELKKPLKNKLELQEKLDEIAHAKNLNELGKLRLRIEKEIADEAKKGAFSEKQTVQFREQLVHLAEKQRDLARQAADQLKDSMSDVQQFIKRRADIFSGKGEGTEAGHGFTQDLLGGISDEEMAQQLATNRTEDIRKQHDAATVKRNVRRGGRVVGQQFVPKFDKSLTPAQLRRVRAGQLNALKQGNINNITEFDKARARAQIARNKLDKLIESGAINDRDAQAMSDSIDSMVTPEMENANLADTMNRLNRSKGNAKGRRASPLAQAQQRAKQSLRRGMGYDNDGGQSQITRPDNTNKNFDQGQNLLPRIASDLMKTQVDGASEILKMNKETSEQYRKGLQALASEMTQGWEQLKQVRGFMASFLKESNDRQRAAQRGLAN